MLAYAIKRVLQFIPTVIAVTLILFLLLNVIPGDAALVSGGLRVKVDKETMEQMRHKMGLDKPMHIRYFNYLLDLTKGELGRSYLGNQKVSTMVGPRVWPTLKLISLAMFISIVLGIPLGFFSALRQGSWMDTLTMVGAVSGISLPQFWLGLLLMYFFSVSAGLLPTSGYGNGELKYLILPAFTLGIGNTALMARTTRAAVIEILSADYIRTAQSKGLSEFLVNRKHVLRNALILILTTAGLQFGTMIGESAIVEKLFGWPGIGSLLVDSIFQRNIPITQACVLIIVLVFLVVNLVVDLLYGLIDPRISYK